MEWEFEQDVIEMVQVYSEEKLRCDWNGPSI